MALLPECSRVPLLGGLAACPAPTVLGRRGTLLHVFPFYYVVAHEHLVKTQNVNRGGTLGYTVVFPLCYLSQTLSVFSPIFCVKKRGTRGVH